MILLGLFTEPQQSDQDASSALLQGSAPHGAERTTAVRFCGLESDLQQAQSAAAEKRVQLHPLFHMGIRQNMQLKPVQGIQSTSYTTLVMLRRLCCFHMLYMIQIYGCERRGWFSFHASHMREIPLPSRRHCGVAAVEEDMHYLKAGEATRM